MCRPSTGRLWDTPLHLVQESSKCRLPSQVASSTKQPNHRHLHWDQARHHHHRHRFHHLHHPFRDPQTMPGRRTQLTQPVELSSTRRLCTRTIERETGFCRLHLDPVRREVVTLHDTAPGYGHSMCPSRDTGRDTLKHDRCLIIT